MSAKLFFILFVSMVVMANANVDEVVKEFFDTCVTESGTTKEEAMKLKEHDFSSNDPKVKCFAKCFCEKAKMCDDKLNLVVSKLEDHIPADAKAKVDAAAAACTSTTGTDDCDAVYQRFKCFFVNLK